MEEEFIPFNLALELKELKCDVKTFAYYDMQGKLYPMGTVVGPQEIYFGIFNPKFQYKPQLEPLVSAPLWQQAFDWLLELTDYSTIPIISKTLDDKYYCNGKSYDILYDANKMKLETLIKLCYER